MATQHFTAIPGAGGIYTVSGLTLNQTTAQKHTIYNSSGATVEVQFQTSLPDVGTHGHQLLAGDSLDFQLLTAELVYARTLRGVAGVDLVVYSEIVAIV